MSPHRRCDDGQVGGIEVLPFGLLTFVAATLLVASAWGVVDARFAADSAAREATRVLVERAHMDVGSEQLTATARAVAIETLAGIGRRGDIDVEVTTEGDRYDRCALVTVTVRFRVPPVRFPGLGASGPGVLVRASHREVVDPTRSGVGGRAWCLS